MKYIVFLSAFAILATCDHSTRNCDSGLVDELTNCSDDSMCPTWFICTSEKNCSCGNQPTDEIICDNNHHSSYVLDGYCVTYDEETKSTYVGSCFFNSQYNEAKHSCLPKNPKQLINNSVCTQFHRTGLLCGDCLEGYSPFVLSYNLSCVKCPGGHKNWWKFILVAYIPLTLFYFIVFLFNINVTSSHLHGVVWYSQALTMPILSRRIMHVLRYGDQRTLIALKIIFVFYSFWNLDLFRSVLPDICLNVTTLQALALDYLVAFYPLLLLLISYFVIKLYDRKVSFIVTLWKPFQSVFSAFRKSWKVQTSLIDAFATFFLLSYVKILHVTVDLLVPTQIYQLGSNTPTLGLFYSPSVAYFGDDHRPYAILAVIILILFVLLPTFVLILYPFQCFHKLLSLFPMKWNTLHAFVDSFQGCYKDGTEPGTYDCRWFSVLILLIRLLLNFMLITTNSSAPLFIYATIVLVVYLIAVINIQPYKKMAVRYPSTEPHFLIFLSLSFIALLGNMILPSKGLKIYHTAVKTFGVISVFASLIYIIFFIGFWLATRKR